MQKSEYVLQHKPIGRKANRAPRFTRYSYDARVFQQRPFLLFDKRRFDNDTRVRLQRLKITADTCDKYLDILVVHSASVFDQKLEGFLQFRRIDWFAQKAASTSFDRINGGRLVSQS